MGTWIKKHYHWVIAIVVLLEMSIYVGFLNNLTGLHIVPVTDELHISRGSFSLAISMKHLVGFFTTMISGVLFLKFGYRKMVLGGLLLGSVAYTILALSQNVVTIAFGTIVMGLLDFVCSSTGATKIVGTWFFKYRGTVLGLVSASTGIGGSIFCIILNRIIETYGWRYSYGFCAVLVLLMAILMFFLIRNRPSDVGLMPYGLGHTPTKKPRNSILRPHWLGLSFQEMLRRPSFYLMLLGTFLSCGCMYMAFNVVVPHLTDRGLSASEAAAMQSILLLSMAGAKFLSGALSDLIGARAVTMSCLAASAASLWLMAGITDTSSSIVALLLFAWALPATTITVPLLTTSLFGYQSSDRAIGVFLAIVTLSSMIATPLSNALYDVLGSYSPIFRVCAIVTIGIMLLFAVLYILSERDKHKFHVGETMEETE